MLESKVGRAAPGCDMLDEMLEPLPATVTTVTGQPGYPFSISSAFEFMEINCEGSVDWTCIYLPRT